MELRTQQVIVHGVAKSQTRLSTHLYLFFSETKQWVCCSINLLVKIKCVFYFYLKTEGTFWPTEYKQRDLVKAVLHQQLRWKKKSDWLTLQILTKRLPFLGSRFCSNSWQLIWIFCLFVCFCYYCSLTTWNWAIRTAPVAITTLALLIGPFLGGG